MNLTCGRGRATTAWIGVGAGIGAAFGAATHAMGMSLALGIAIGALADVLLATCAKPADTQRRTRGDGDDQ